MDKGRRRQGSGAAGAELIIPNPRLKLLDQAREVMHFRRLALPPRDAT